MSALKVYLFKDSFRPIIELMGENGLSWSMKEQRSGVTMASSGVVEVVLNASMWVSMASVVIAFIRAKHGRKVIITMKDKRVIHAEGLTSKELECILQKADSITALDAGKSNR
ncbi:MULTISPECIES: hypothetical protein [Halomonas]|uniref:Uncharacterized protein n=1 Tax=Halomonas halophila TaxID=29573 RepID=A0ABQ0U2S6_9GAMM|nr:MULTISPECIES: hypothetical protein [Halomonas]MDR5888640.1 hypothetical protein [Halomonas salina]WJY07821.1 hypothetical protein QWG60_02685 [Halomonas halophila]GEK71998.1 hypothetical protein HHA04nite_05420 [Halomonas halophila]